MKIYLNKLRQEKSIFWFWVDVFMIILVIINLLWMGFDMAFSAKIFRELIYNINEPFFVYYYENIHPNFLFYDLFFVSIFIAEFILRWWYDSHKKHYIDWHAYPFYHWYDIIGCIPLQAFRFLRLIRIFSLIIRLHKKGVIDIREWWSYKLSMKYYSIFMEEVSDRVTVNIISGAQEEIKEGAPMINKIVTEVIQPQQKILSKWASERIKYASTKVYNDKREDIRNYVALAVKEAVEHNKEISDLEKIPVIGKQIAKTLESSISDITYNVIEKTMIDLATEDTSAIIEEIIEVSLETITHPSDAVKFEEATKEMAIKTLDIVKEQVKVKRWKSK